MNEGRIILFARGRMRAFVFFFAFDCRTIPT
jgi:hypothetical protein